MTFGFLSAVFLAWINCKFNFAATQREILSWWTGHVVDRGARLGRNTGGECAGVSGQSLDVGGSGDVRTFLGTLVPNVQQVTQMVCTVYSVVFKPNIARHDQVLQQAEG